VTFAALDLFACIKATWTAAFRGFHRLAVDHAGGRASSRRQASCRRVILTQFSERKARAERSGLFYVPCSLGQPPNPRGLFLSSPDDLTATRLPAVPRFAVW
jgi:hypothetical protein